MAYVLTTAGLALLLFGGEALVRGAVAVAKRLGVSPLVVGLTVVAFATSAPELLVSVEAALSGSPGIALGNVVGSNIANIALVIGLVAVVRPMRVDRDDVRPDIVVMLLASVVLVGLGLLGRIGRLAGLMFLATLAVYLVGSYLRERAAAQGSPDWHVEEAEAIEGSPLPNGLFAVGMVIVGVGALVVGASLLVDGASQIARILGVPESVIGLSIVAFGTSLPELATSVIGAWRGHPDVAVGNVLGSNIFNILLILGTTALISPLSVSRGVALGDMGFMLLVAVAGSISILKTGSVGRVLGAALFAAYIAYLVMLYVV